MFLSFQVKLLVSKGLNGRERHVDAPVSSVRIGLVPCLRITNP
jgi:hypothetical protein